MPAHIGDEGSSYHIAKQDTYCRCHQYSCQPTLFSTLVRCESVWPHGQENLNKYLCEASKEPADNQENIIIRSSKGPWEDSIQDMSAEQNQFRTHIVK